MKSKRDLISTILQIIFAISVVIFLIYIEKVGSSYPNNIEHMESIGFIGTYQESEDAKVYELNADNMPNAEQMQQVILRGHFSRDIARNVQLFMYLNRAKVMIKKNGETIFTYGEEKDIPAISKSLGIEWVSVNSLEIRSDDYIEIQIRLVYKDNYKEVYKTFLESLCTGDRYTLLEEQMKKKNWNIVLSLLMLVAGVQLLATVITFQLVKVDIPAGSVSCGLFVISGTICTLIDYDFITLLFKNVYFINILDNVLQLLICECLALYLRSYLRTTKFIIISQIISGVWTFLASMYLWMQATGMADGPELIYFYIPLAIAMFVIITIFLIIDAKKYSEKRILSVLFASYIVTIAAVIELIYYYLTKQYMIYIFQVGLFYFTVSQLVLLFHAAKRNFERIHRADELENELTKNRIAVMISQIQPHFLYNTLTSIQELCLTSPQKAHKAISWFAQFLRGNMDSLSTTELIPFEKELNHVKNYLKLELMRFGDFLNVEYEIGISDFYLPALCVQPIVENAVRYGLSPKEDGGTVRIETYEKSEMIIIKVTDDGVGFEQNTFGNVKGHEQAERSHIGIENVTKRIQQQCDGDVKVTSKSGVGTEVVIQIPKERAK